jgi:hypothetical protein
VPIDACSVHAVRERNNRAQCSISFEGHALQCLIEKLKELRVYSCGLFATRDPHPEPRHFAGIWTTWMVSATWQLPRQPRGVRSRFSDGAERLA